MKLDKKFKKMFSGRKDEGLKDEQLEDIVVSSEEECEETEDTISEYIEPISYEGITYESIKDEIKVYLAAALSIPIEDVRDNSHFIDDLGGDSLQSLELFTKVEQRYRIMIPDEDYFNCKCINDIASLISKKIQEKIASGQDDNDINSNNENQYEQLNSNIETGTEIRKIRRITTFEESREMEAFCKRLNEANETTSMLGSVFENPYFVEHDSALRDTSIIDGKQVLNFGSYNYLGLSGHPETVKAACEAAVKYGTSASGSRLLAGEKPLFRELEAEIAKWKHTEASLVLVGGHSTNVTIVGNFCNQNDLILYDILSHNSIMQGTVLSRSKAKHFPHNDYAALEKILAQHRDEYEKVLIVVEGVYSMDGDIAPIPEFVKLKNKYGCFLMVDEAHSSCVIGPHAGGVDDYFNLDPYDIDIKMGTLSKGLGACGGYIAGKKCMIEYMKYNIPGFVFSVGISPPVAAAALAAVRLIENDDSMVKRLHANIKCFVDEAKKRNLNTCLAKETAIIPILVGKDENGYILSSLLKRRGVFVPPAVYPAVAKNQARLRFCVTSEHKEEQIITALDALVAIAGEMNITLPPAE